MNNFGPNESHNSSYHPEIWRWLTELAHRDYDGNVSAAIAGLVAYDRGIFRAKLLKGEKHSHHVTAGLVNNRENLEAAIREIESDEPGFNAMTWLEIQRRKQQDTPPE